MERVEVIRAGIGMCQVIRQNQIFHKSFLAKGASLSFVLAEYWREQKRDRSEIRVYCTARVVVLIFVFSFLL